MCYPIIIKHMKLNKTKITLLSLAFLPMMASAELGVTSKLDSVVNVPTPTNLKTNLNSNIDVNLNEENTNGNANSNLQVGINGNIQENLNNNNSLGIMINTASQVNSDADLKVFSSAIANKSQVIAETRVESDNNQTIITVNAVHNGWLFGLFDVNFESTTNVEVNSDNSITVSSQPSWWSIFVTSNYDETKIESDLKSNSKIKAHTNAEINASTKVKAEILAQVAAQVEASTNATVKVN